MLVAFAAETHDAIENARGKLLRKRADLIVVNEVGVDKVFRVRLERSYRSGS